MVGGVRVRLDCYVCASSFGASFLFLRRGKEKFLYVWPLSCCRERESFGGGLERRGNHSLVRFGSK